MRRADAAPRGFALRPALVDWDVEALLDRWLYTPLGRGLARALLTTRIRPNQVSFASLVSGALAGLCYGTGDATARLGDGQIVTVDGGAGTVQPG